MKPGILKNTISLIALGLIVTHMIWPFAAIDGVTIGLLAIAIIPWLSPLFKSLQLPGGVKIEYQDLERSGKQMKDAGLYAKKTASLSKKYDFLPEPNDDPTLALAWLRIEIEKRMRSLARIYRLEDNVSLKETMIALFEDHILSDDEYEALRDLLEILGSAIHGVKVDHTAAEWAIEVGPLILKGLDYKLKKK